MSCKINIGLIPSDCQDISVGGVTGRFWLIPQADFLAATLTKGSDNEITAIVPVAPPSGFAFAYRFEVPPRSIVTGRIRMSRLLSTMWKDLSVTLALKKDLPTV